MRPAAWLSGLSPRRRAFLTAASLLVVALAAFGGVRLARSGGPAVAHPDASRPGDVLLVPGYGGGTSALDGLAARIEAAGRTAIVVHLAGDGTGDLQVQAGVLNGYVNRALAAGSGPVTIVGYSAGGVVAWLWDVEDGGAAKARAIVTLGAPLHGAQLAAVGEAVDPAACPQACQQLVPGSALLTRLARSPAADRPPWLSLWTTDDEVVRPADSARLAGAINVPLQSICPGATVTHSQLPTAPLVVGIVLRSLGPGPLTTPRPSQCRSLQASGS